jgi:hypothetical protein
LQRVRATVPEDKVLYALWDHKYAWLPLVKGTEPSEDNRLDVELNDSGRIGFQDNISRILVTNLRRMRSTWILVQSFKKRMPRVDKEQQIPLLRQDLGRLFFKETHE